MLEILTLLLALFVFVGGQVLFALAMYMGSK